MADSENIINIELPLVLSSSEAAQLAEIVQEATWRERNKYEFSLPFKYVYLEPTDVVTIVVDDVTHVVRITEIDTGKPGILQCKGVAEVTASYSSTATGEDGSASTNTVGLKGPTSLQLLDIPLLRDQDDDSGFYLAAGGYFPAWPGCVVYKSTDEGQTYASMFPMIDSTIMGTSTDALADGPTTVFDTENTVNIRLSDTSAQLSSISELLTLNRGNAAVIGLHGSWEIIAFQTATLEADGTYTLSNLIRGAQGTEHNTASHAALDLFILLDSTTMRRSTADDAEIDVERAYKAPTLGSTLPETQALGFTNSAEGLKPYSPVHITLTRDGSNNLDVAWLRRTRIGGDWRDAVGPLLGEDTEAYEIDFVDEAGGSPNPVVTKTGITSESYNYSIADQQTDWGSPVPPVLRVDIYQISATVGRGNVGSKSE